MKSTQKGSTLWVLSIIIVLLVVIFGVYVYLQSSKTSKPISNAQTATQPTVVASAINMTVWPDVKSFDLTNKTFLVTGIGVDYKKYSKPVKIITNISTIYYTGVGTGDGSINKEYHDFQWLYSTLKNWIGPEWMFHVNGVRQGDGAVLAREVYMIAQ